MQADVERLLARLLTDSEFRARFLADPKGVATREGLSAAEAEAVSRMPASDLRTAARSYEHKRSRAVRGRARNWLTRFFGTTHS